MHPTQIAMLAQQQQARPPGRMMKIVRSNRSDEIIVELGERGVYYITLSSARPQ